MAARSRLLASLAATLVVLVAPSAGSADVRTMSSSNQLQTALLGQVNTLRAANGLGRLRLSTSLSAAAGRHSTEMARRGYFSHDSANGQSFSTRIAHAYSPRGYRSWSVGENLVWGGPDIGAARAFQLWLSSPPHRANLLNARWREVGLGAVHSSSAPGVYGGGPATIVTADFGARSR